jgi:hypothetical protein
MDYTQLIEILKILGTSSVAFIIYLILKELGVMLKNKNGPSEERLAKVEKILSNDYRHEIDNLWTEIRELREDINNLSKDYSNTIKEIETRLVKLETKKHK